MRNAIYALVAASLAMLATSGIVALATAAPPEQPAVDTEAVDDTISEFIDAEYRKVMAAREREES